MHRLLLQLALVAVGQHVKLPLCSASFTAIASYTCCQGLSANCRGETGSDFPDNARPMLQPGDEWRLRRIRVTGSRRQHRVRRSGIFMTEVESAMVATPAAAARRTPVSYSASGVTTATSRAGAGTATQGPSAADMQRKAGANAGGMFSRAEGNRCRGPTRRPGRGLPTTTHKTVWQTPQAQARSAILTSTPDWPLVLCPMASSRAVREVAPVLCTSVRRRGKKMVARRPQLPPCQLQVFSRRGSPFNQPGAGFSGHLAAAPRRLMCVTRSVFVPTCLFSRIC